MTRVEGKGMGGGSDLVTCLTTYTEREERVGRGR